MPFNFKISGKDPFNRTIISKLFTDRRYFFFCEDDVIAANCSNAAELLLLLFCSWEKKMLHKADLLL